MAADGLMIAASGSGSGKTMITCGLLRLFSRRGLRVHSFKCGPDYIDPMFHGRILGIPCRNLDPYFADADTLAFLYGKRMEERDLAVVEGVMGYYDGIGGMSERGSSYELARTIGVPVILVISCKGMSLSAAAVIRGFLDYKAESGKNSGIAGVILNQVSEKIYPDLKAAIEKNCRIPVVGFVPVRKDLAVESRHLGLVTPDQVENLQEKMDRLADLLEQTVDLERLLKISRMAGRLSAGHPAMADGLEAVAGDPAEVSGHPAGSVGRPSAVRQMAKIRQTPVKIAVARDEAFCFLYQDNLELLEELGAELVFFSPLKEEKLPEGISGLILSGGYPELYAGRLSQNRGMLASVKEAVTGGMPTLAECGGFLYLHRFLEDDNGVSYPMAGVIEAKAYKTGRLQRFGYMELTAGKDQLFLKKGETMRAHEFHYWDSEDCGCDCHAVKASGRGVWDCVHGNENFYGGFPHIYFYGRPEAAARLIERCALYQEESGKGGRRKKSWKN